MFDQQIIYPKHPSANFNASQILILEDLFAPERSYAISSEGSEKLDALNGPELAELRSRLELKARDLVRERRSDQRVDVALRAIITRQKARVQRSSEILRWFLVSEEKPDADQTVIGFNEVWADRCWPCSFDGEEWTSVEGCQLNGRGKDPEKKPPTHWAPWPAGPRSSTVSTPSAGEVAK